MARYYDKHIEGTNQIEYLHRTEGDIRRHKVHCIYYDNANGYCHKLVRKCTGSAHCDHYQEKAVIEREEYKSTMPTDEQKKAIKAADERRLRAYIERVKKKTVIEHRLKGNGRLISVDGDTLVVRFLSDGKELSLSAKFCMDNNLLLRI